MTRQHIECLIGWTLGLVLISVGMQLGHWQLQRMHDKQAFLDAHAHALAGPAQTLDHALAQANRVQRVDDCGHWEPFVLVLDSQQRQQRPGHVTYQVLQTGQQQRLLIEQGWRAWSGDRTPPQAVPLRGTVCLKGVLVPAPSSGLVLGAPSVQALPGGGWLIDRLASAVLHQVPGLPALNDARVVRPDPSLPWGYLRDDTVLPNTLPPQRHLGYAVQWFSLSAAVAVGLLLLLCRGFRKRPGRHHPDTSEHVEKGNGSEH